MSALISYKLTQYNDIRQIEFQYSKLQDENAQLKSKLQTVEEIYRQSIISYEDERIDNYKKQAYLKSQIQENRLKLQQFVIFFKQLYTQFQNYQKLSVTNLSNSEEYLLQTDKGNNFIYQSMKQQLNMIVKWSLKLMNKSNDVALKYQKQLQRAKSQFKMVKNQQKQLKNQLSYLSDQINKIQNTNVILMNQLSLLKRQNTDYKLKLYEMNKIQEEKRSQPINQDIIEDSSFALDLLQYQKELLQRIFTKMISFIPIESIKEIITDLYHSYQKVTQNFREKLQIQYDLQDLEREYKREKNSKVNQQLLIELRKQIQEFRIELQKQKETMVKQEEKMENIFFQLQSCEREQRNLRDYTVQIQKKFKQIRSYNETKRGQQASGHYGSRIQLKVTSNDEIMKEVLKKDRENIDKIFKETRNVKYLS